MTTDFNTDEIVILKNNEEREEIIAKNGEFIIDTYSGMKLKDIPNGQGIPIWNGMSVRFELGEEWNLRLVQQTEERKEDEDEQTV